MRFTHLNHDRRLRYPLAKDLRCLPDNVETRYACDRLVSFRLMPERHKPDDVVNKLHAAMRPMGIYDGNAICFYGVQSDSPLAPLLLWDAVHFMEVGQKITLVEDSPIDSYLDRAYFCQGMKTLSRTAIEVTYEKTAKFPAEGDDDLDSWTFGIPVGPEDATILNAAVKRILELDIPRKEIILCGRPADNFAYFDHVRIVGEDIPAPPVQICKKKNRLAQEATYNNLVILHDRVFLPSHFGEMVRRFGPRYPLMVLQSLWFDDHLCLHPRRYSDAGMFLEDLSHGAMSLHKQSCEAVKISSTLFPEIERSAICYSNPMRYKMDSRYPTGSLYICRKAVWETCPLDEALLWNEFEDVEHGIRASKNGIPFRFNPFGISQTITSRPTITSDYPVETPNGTFSISRTKTGLFFSKKPITKVSYEIALKKLKQFAQKYHDIPSRINISTGKKSISGIAWLRLIYEAIQQANFPNTASAVREFIEDYEKLVLFEPMAYSEKETCLLEFQKNPKQARNFLFFRVHALYSMFNHHPVKGWFYHKLQDYFHKKSSSLFGIFLTSIRLFRKNGEYFYFESFLAAIRAIYHSTPFFSYTKENA